MNYKKNIVIDIIELLPFPIWMASIFTVPNYFLSGWTGWLLGGWAIWCVIISIIIMFFEDYYLNIKYNDNKIYQLWILSKVHFIGSSVYCSFVFLNAYMYSRLKASAILMEVSAIFAVFVSMKIYSTRWRN